MLPNFILPAPVIVQFPSGGSQPDVIFYRKLNEVAAFLHQNAHISLRIEGHTDSRGDAATNRRLAEERAEFCFQYLQKQGIAQARMHRQNFSGTQPVASNQTAPGRQQNRRVTLIYEEK